MGEGGYLLGNTAKNLPWTCVSGGSQTTHAMTRAAHAVATEGNQEIARDRGEELGGKPEDYVVANERVTRKGGGAGMTLAQCAQKAIQLGGAYDGHEAPDDVNKMTKASMAALAGQGLIVAAKDKYPHDGNTHSFVASFAEVEVDKETGKYHIVDFLAMADVGTVIHPRALGAQVMGRSILESATRSVRSGSTINTTVCLWRNASTTPSLRRFSMFHPKACSGQLWIFRIRKLQWARAASGNLRWAAVAR